jgi:hypothetical protein
MIQATGMVCAGGLLLTILSESLATRGEISSTSCEISLPPIHEII